MACLTGNKGYPMSVPVKQAGVFAVRQGPEGWRVLVISNNSGKRWVIPKGIMDPGFTDRETAQKEAFEEAGIHGSLITPALGKYRYRKWGRKCEVTVFLMDISAVEEAWPEKNTRIRKWLALEEMGATIDSRIPRKLLNELKDKLKQAEGKNG